jgi:hypothetical protein
MKQMILAMRGSECKVCDTMRAADFWEGME